MQSEEASSLQPTPLPASSGERSDLRSVIAVAMVAYAASSVVHELVGHGSGCLLTGVKPLLVTSILLQSAGGNRIVDVGGPLANILFGAGAFYWFQRQAKFTAFSYSLWLFAALNFLVAAGYPFYSGVSNWGDWASAIRELHPQYAWRAAISLAGILLYILVVRLLCRSLIKLVREGGIGRSDVRRLIYPAYFTCGLLALLRLGGTLSLSTATAFLQKLSRCAYCVQVALIIFSVSTRKSAVSRLPVLFFFCASSPASSLPTGRP